MVLFNKKSTFIIIAFLALFAWSPAFAQSDQSGIYTNSPGTINASSSSGWGSFITRLGQDIVGSAGDTYKIHTDSNGDIIFNQIGFYVENLSGSSETWGLGLIYTLEGVSSGSGPFPNCVDQSIPGGFKGWVYWEDCEVNTGSQNTYTEFDIYLQKLTPRSLVLYGYDFNTWEGGNCHNDNSLCGDIEDLAIYLNIASFGGWEAFEPEEEITTECVGTDTQICAFNPAEGEIVATSTDLGADVDFNLEVYINSDDVGSIAGVKITLYNINQNVLFTTFSPSTFFVVNEVVEEAGRHYWEDTQTLPIGNYRLKACLARVYFGWIPNPFANLIDEERDCQSHQFIVGEGTFIGDLSQTGYNIFNTLANGTSTTATSTASAGNCYFWYPSSFNIFKCGAFLFIPDSYYLNESIEGFRDGVLIRVPWGYVTRTYEIFSASTTVALPEFTTTFQIGTNGSVSTTSLTFDPGDMLTGASALLTDTRDPITNKNARDVFEPFVQLAVALAVLLTIIADITGSHRHSEPEIKQGKKT